MMIFGLQADDFSEWLKEFVSVTYYEVEIKLFDNICFFLQYLRIRI